MSWSALVVTIVAVRVGSPSTTMARIAQANEPPAAAPAPGTTEASAPDSAAPRDAAPASQIPPTSTPPAAPSAVPTPAAPPPGAPAKIKFNFKGATFQQVIDFFSRTTGLPVIWKTPAPDGTLDYISPDSYELTEALKVLNIVLQSKGVMLRVDDQKLLLQKLEAMQKEDIPTYIGKLPETVTNDQIVTVVRSLKVALAKGMAEKLATMVAAYGSVTAMEQQNSLVITETAANIRRILTIIDQLDMDDPEGAVEIISVKNAQATALMGPLNALLSQRVEKFVINQKGEQVKIEETQMPGLQMSADERTNAIIAKGIQSKIDKLKEAIRLLDVPAVGQGRSMSTISLARTTPADAAAKLNSLFQNIVEKDRPTVLALDDAAKITIVGDDDAVRQGTLLLNELEGGLIANPSAVENQQPVVAVMALDKATPQNVITAITSLLNKRQQVATKIIAGPDGRSLIVSGLSGDVDAVKSLVPVLDRQTALDKQVRLVRITNGDPRMVFDKAKAAFDQQKAPGAVDPQLELASTLDADSRVVTLIGPVKALDSFTNTLKQIESSIIIDREVRRIALTNVIPSEIVGSLSAMTQQLLQPRDGAAFVAPTFTAVDPINALMVTATPQQFDALKPIIEGLDVSTVPGGAAQTQPLRILQLRIADAASLANVLTARYSQRGAMERKNKPVNIAADPQTNSLLVMAHPDLMPEIQAMVDELNTTERMDLEAREIKIYPLKVARAAELARTIDEMFPQPPVPVDVRGRPQPQFQKPRPVVVRADVQTNSLIISAIPGMLHLTGEMISQLDVDPSQTSNQPLPMKIFQLRIADAASLANVLTTRYSQRTVLEQKNKPVNIGADAQTNSLLVTAHLDLLPEIQAMVDELNKTERMDAEAREVKIFPLKVARAEQLAKTIDEMFPIPPVPVDVRGRPQPQFQKPRPVVVRADPQTNSLIIAAIPGMLNLTGEMIQQLDVDTSEAANQSMPMRIFQLRIADAPSLANVLTTRYNQRTLAEQKNKPVTIGADPQTNSLLVTAHTDLMPEIQAMVDELNKTERMDAEAREIKIFPLKVARAEELAKTIDEMFPMPPVPVDVRGRPQPQFQKPRPVVVRADVQTNSLIISAVPGMLSFTGEMISQLDVDPAQISGAAARSLHVLAIENADAAQLAQNLEAMFSAPGQVEVRPTIRADAVSNTLLIRATESQFKTIEQVVTQVDRATIVSSRQVQMIAIDPAKANAEELARTLQRMIDRTSGVSSGAAGGSKVEVISLEELIKRREVEKTQPPAKSTSLWLQINSLVFAAIPQEVPKPVDEPQTTIAVDKASNSLIILGSPRALERIAALAKQLQDQIPSAPGTVRYVTLPDSVDVQTVANLIQQAMSRITPAAGAPGDLTRRVAVIPDPAGNALIITANDIDFGTVADLIAAFARPAVNDLPIHTLTLQRAEASVVAVAVQKFFDDRAKLNPRNRSGQPRPQRVALLGIETGNTLLVSANDEDFAQVEQLVKQFDTIEANAGLTFRVFQLQHAKATEIERNVQSLVNDLVWGQGDIYFYPWMQQSSSKKKDTVAVRADPRLNALIVTGRGDKFDVVEKMIEILDAPPPSGGERIVRLYRLQHAQLQMVADIVSETFNKGRQRRPWEAPDPTAIGIRSDDTANVLIVSASAKEHEEIKSLINNIDSQLAVAPHTGEAVGSAPTPPPMQVIPVKYARAAELSQMLMRFLTDRAKAQNLPKPAATVIASDSTNTLIVAAAPAELATIQDLLKQLDQPDVTGDRVVQIIAIKQGRSDDIMRILKEQFARRMPGAAAGAGVIVTSDARTNSIIINAPQQEFAQAKALIERLDAPSDADETIIRTYALKGAAAEQAVRVLSQTLQLDSRGQTPGKGTTIKMDDPNSAPVDVKARIVPDKRSNSLIVTATPESFPVIESLIKKLDDVPTATPQEYRIITLKFAMADDLAATLNQITRPAGGGAVGEDGQPAPRINASRMENKLIIAATPDQYQRIEAIIKQIDQPSDEQRITDFIPLKFAQAQKLQEALSVFYGQLGLEADTPSKKSVRIVADPATNSLVISAEKSEWEGIRSMLTRLDNAEYDSSLQLKVLPLVYADAQSVARAINDAFQSSMQRPMRGGGGNQGQQRNQFNFPGMDFMQQGFGTLLVQADEWVRASAEPQTNSVIVSASRQNMNKVEAILKQLDVADYAKLPAPKLIPVSGGSDPIALANSLTQLYQQSRPGGSSGGSAYPPVSIVGNTSANSLIVRAEKDDFEQIKALAEALQQQASSNGLTVHILKLNAAPAGRIATALNEAFQAKAKQANQPLSIRIDPTGNSLIIASTGPLYEEIKASATQLDSMAPAGGQGVFIIDLKNIPPETAKSVIETIGLDKPQPADSISRLVSEPVKVSLIPGRNAIAIVAAPADRDTIVGLLKAIDADPTLAEAQMRIIRLKHAQAQALTEVLTQVLKPGDQQTDTPLAKAIREQIRRLAVTDPTLPGVKPSVLDLTKPIRLFPEPLGNALVVSSTKENLDAIQDLVSMFDQLPITDQVTVQIFPLQNISAEQFARIVKDMFTQGKQLGKTVLTRIPGVPEGAVGKALLEEIAISTDERTNTVIVAGTEDSVALVEVLSKRIDSDVAQGWVEPKVVPLRFADAGDLAQTLQSILVDDIKNLPQSTPIQRQIARLRMARIKPIPGSNLPPTVLESDVFTPMTRLIIRPEPQMNAIILVGTPANIEVVSELVALLDIEAASPANSVRIYPIENASASKLATTIKQLFDGQVQSKVLRPEDRVNVQSDERTNALIVATSSRSFAVLEGMLKTLDSKIAPELREIRSIEMKNASAVRVAALIQQMMDARLERLRKVQPESADLERATVIADPRTNSLIAAAGNDTFEVIKRLAADLDVSTLSDASLVNVLTLPKSSNIDRVASAINQIMDRRWADMPAELRMSQRPLVLTDPRTSSLLISANPEDMAAIQQLVSRIAEAPLNPAVGINLITLASGTRAENIAPRLQRLMTERQQTLGTSNTPSDRVTIEADLASNSLIIAASDENLEVIKGLMNALVQADAEAAGGGGREVELVTLRASRAGDVIDMLGDLYVKEANRVRGQNTVRVRSDERLNAVVINAPPGDVRAIKGLIAQLDGTRPASVVEIKYVPLQSANALETVGLIENVLSGRGIGARSGSRQATVLKYLREIAKTQATPTTAPNDMHIAESTTQTALEGPVEMEVSAAIRETISLTPDLRTNTIIVSAPRESITMIERMIRDLDESTGGAKNIRIFKLTNADATAMAQILTDLFRLKQGKDLYVLKPREDSSGASLASSRDVNNIAAAAGEDAGVGPAPAAPPIASGVASGGGGGFGGIGGTELTAVPDERQQLAITVDSRTNSLIVSGTPTYLDLVDQVVKELDSLEANERMVYVYQLRNAVAADVAKVVGDFVAQEQKKLISTLSADQLGSSARLLEREITIQGDTKSNTVLVSASPRYMDRVKEMIRKLDVDPPQVLIQVMLAEVTLDSRDEWGVNFNAMAKIGSTTVSGGYGLATAFVTGLGVPNLSVAGSDFDLLIRAMKSQGRLQVLSNPSIMAANNAPARIQVGETIQVPTSSSISAAGQTSTTLESEDLGVILTVTPSINPDGFVRMEISPQISNLSARTTQVSADFQAPIITRRTADTTVTVHDGQTIVIGGLISDRYERRDRKIPLLGDIPLIGILFRANVEETTKTELLIVLTPHVIASPAEFDRVESMTNFEVDRLSLPPDVKDQIRQSILEGTGGLYDARGNRIDLKKEDQPK